MKTTIAINSVCTIVAPACAAARGTKVVVLRLANDQPDVDGVIFKRSPPHATVWVVRSLANPIEWGTGEVMVLAIGEECLSLETVAIPHKMQLVEA